MDPDVTSRCFSPFTNASRKVAIFPGAKNLSVIRLISALRLSIDVDEELVGLGKTNYKKCKAVSTDSPDNGVPGRDPSENGVELCARTAAGTARGA